MTLAYERAVSAFPVTSELWLQYARYLEAKMQARTLKTEFGMCAMLLSHDPQPYIFLAGVRRWYQ